MVLDNIKMLIYRFLPMIADVGYVTTKTSSEDASNIPQHKENIQEISDEKFIQKVNEIHKNFVD